MKKINTFWNLFQDNNQSIKNLINETHLNQKHISFWISKNLSYYCKEIDFMLIMLNNANAKSELIISANGNPDNFQKVIDLIDNAPKLRTWKFSTFIKPLEEINNLIKSLDEPYIITEISLKASELKFLSSEYDAEIQKVDIIIYLKNYNLHCDTKTWNQALFVIMQNLFKEKYLHRHINFIQLAQKPENHENLIYLQDFQFYIDNINSF